jgi:hypothetical protein
MVIVKTRVLCNIENLAEKNAISSRRNTDYSALAIEMEELFYSNAKYHPTRWYTAPPKYRGVYVTTDSGGWRFDRTTIPEGAAKLLCFGGSTMFSTTTRDQGAIPAMLQRHLAPGVACVLNYGMGGYSTYAEIGAFCEAMRREKNVALAIFYDGVNETAMYLEMLMHRREQTFLAEAGYPFMSVVRVATRNFLSEQGVVWRLAVRLAGMICRITGNRGCGGDSVGRAVPERERFYHAKRIVDGYIANLKILQGIGQSFGVGCVFVWQPDIFTTGKRLTERERRMAENYPPLLKKLSRMVYRLVVSHPTFRDLGGVDGVNWLNQLEGEHFFDYCHVSEEANEVIAAEIAKVCKRRTPAEFWKCS